VARVTCRGVRVLVTGATGFIGSHVVRRLLLAGHRVRALARGSSDVSSLPSEVEIARGELDGAGDACSGMEGLVHLAGMSGTLLRRGDPGRDLRRVNVEGTARLFAAARKAGVRRGVLITSMWSVLRPELAAVSPYVKSRVDSEQAALDAGGAGVKSVILCPGFVVGAGDRGPNFPGGVILAFLRGRLPVAPPGGSTWISVTDAADTVVAALDRGEPGTRYIVGAEYLTYRDIGHAVSRMMGVRAPLATAPFGVVKAGGLAADRVLRLLGRHAPIPIGIGADLLCQRAKVDCTETWRVFGQPRVPVIDAVREAAEWFVASSRR
jgi:dihydroflavonol-4-reductase